MGGGKLVRGPASPDLISWGEPGPRACGGGRPDCHGGPVPGAGGDVWCGWCGEVLAGSGEGAGARVVLPVRGAGSGRASGGLTGTAGVIRSGRSRARVIAARTAPADGAWYSQKQVSSSATRIAPRKRTGAPCWLACPAASAMSAQRRAPRGRWSKIPGFRDSRSGERAYGGAHARVHIKTHPPRGAPASPRGAATRPSWPRIRPTNRPMTGVRGSSSKYLYPSPARPNAVYFSVGGRCRLVSL